MRRGKKERWEYSAAEGAGEGSAGAQLQAGSRKGLWDGGQGQGAGGISPVRW